MDEAQTVTVVFTENGASEPAPKIVLDEDDLAVELAQTWKGQVQRLHRDWRVYAGGYWQPRDPEQVQQQVRQFLRTKRPFGIKVTAARMNGVTKLLESECHVPDDKIASQAHERARYINLRNGLYNLQTHKLEPHRPELYFIQQLPFAYDPNAEPRMFVQYLTTSLMNEAGEPDNDLIHFLMQAIGYSLTARTDLKAAFWLVGKPDSGKSTLLSILSKLAGELHTAVDLNELGARFGLAAIIGKRVATCTEANSGTVIRDDVFKTLTGGSDHIQIERKYKDPVTIVPEVKLWWAMNEAPRTKDRSGALLNRLHVIPFNRTIPREQRISDLETRLAGELPGIFNLAMYYYKFLVKNGAFYSSAQSERWKEAYKLKNDTEATFIAECCERDPEATIKGGALYLAYKDWCFENGFHNKNNNQVADDWERLGFHKVHKSDGSHWKGVRLKKNTF